MRRITAQIIGNVLIKQMIFVFIKEKVIFYDFRFLDMWFDPTVTVCDINCKIKSNIYFKVKKSLL